MHVPLSATLAEGVTVVPATVYLRRDANSRAFRPVHLYVVCPSGGQQLGKVSLANGPRGVQIDDLGDASPSHRRIRLSVFGEIGAWPENSYVRLCAEGADMRFGFKLRSPRP